MNTLFALIANHPLLFVLLAAALVCVAMSFHLIGPAQVGLVLKRVGRRLEGGDPVALAGEAGYQADLLMPGLRFRLWPVHAVSKHPWVQIPADHVGLVIAQVGAPLPVGAKSGRYRPLFANFTSLRAFLGNGGEKGVQRPVLPPGTLAPIHPIGFVVVTRGRCYGLPISAEIRQVVDSVGGLDFRVTRIEPESNGRDVCGVVTVLEGPPVEAGDIASRLGGFADIAELEKGAHNDAELIEALLHNKNDRHDNYQDLQRFLDDGGKSGLQHDALPYGAYNLNPLLIRVERVPMLVVEQGEVAVVKAYIGLPTADTSGPQFKHGALVHPGHRGIWQEPLRTGKYMVNPRLYGPVKVPTAILTLNWADYSSKAHDLDKELKSIDAKSREGFRFSIDLQVQLHVPDTMAPRVISRVGSMNNLVIELLQGAVGNHFRNTLQGMAAIEFIEKRAGVQESATAHVRAMLKDYEVETIGVFIQDVDLPEELVKVLKEREIANQEIETFKKKQQAEAERKNVAEATGIANMQDELVKARLGVAVQRDRAAARKALADGEAYYRSETGKAAAVAVEAEGLARAKGYRAQVEALGDSNTARINIARELAGAKVAIVPQVASGGRGGVGAGLLGLLLAERLNGRRAADRTVPPPEKDSKN
jgi:regulator of protease activity HflC (stomatin/prohibitin superfamily)